MPVKFSWEFFFPALVPNKPLYVSQTSETYSKELEGAVNQSSTMNAVILIFVCLCEYPVAQLAIGRCAHSFLTVCESFGCFHPLRRLQRQKLKRDVVVLNPCWLSAWRHCSNTPLWVSYADDNTHSLVFLRLPALLSLVNLRANRDERML